MTTALAVPESERLAAEASSWPSRARELAVDDDDTFAFGSAMVLGIKALRKEIAATFDPMAQKARAAWQEVLDQRKRVEAPLLEADALLAPKLTAFVRRKEQERQIAEAQAREAQRAEEAAARATEARALEAAGEPEAAAEVLAAPVTAPPVVVPPSVPRTGVGTRAVWKAEATDVRALCGAIAAGTVPVDAVTVHRSVLDAAARAMKSELRWPGVRAYQEHGLVRRG